LKKKKRENGGNDQRRNQFASLFLRSHLRGTKKSPFCLVAEKARENRNENLFIDLFIFLKDFKNGITEIQTLRSNLNAEIKKTEALEFTCKSLNQGFPLLNYCLISLSIAFFPFFFS